MYPGSIKWWVAPFLCPVSRVSTISPDLPPPVSSLPVPSISSIPTLVGRSAVCYGSSAVLPSSTGSAPSVPPSVTPGPLMDRSVEQHSLVSLLARSPLLIRIPSGPLTPPAPPSPPLLSCLLPCLSSCRSYASPHGRGNNPAARRWQACHPFALRVCPIVYLELTRLSSASSSSPCWRLHWHWSF